jgi:hypothetical protein
MGGGRAAKWRETEILMSLALPGGLVYITECLTTNHSLCISSTLSYWKIT